jgi:hypothetical protein
MNPTKEPAMETAGDLVLQEIWRIKDERSASYGHDVHRLFEGLRQREKLSGQPVVNLQDVVGVKP